MKRYKLKNWVKITIFMVAIVVTLGVMKYSLDLNEKIETGEVYAEYNGGR